MTRALRPLSPGGRRYMIVLDGRVTESWVEPHGPDRYVAHQGPGPYGRQAIEATPQAAAAALLAITGGADRHEDLRRARANDEAIADACEALME